MKTKEKKLKKTHKQRFRIFLKILLIIILIIAIIGVVTAIANMLCVKSNRNFINSVKPVVYENQLQPELDEYGCTTFVTDSDFRIMQLTDVHIGAGYMSTAKDNMALNAVAAMVTQEKPDLVIVTGDIAYPVPFQAGTFNNRSSAELFAELMEKLQVYWCPVFGNHDTELYSYFSREQISKFYSQDKYSYCLFNAGDESVDGCGNYVINVENTSGEITQSLFMIDSHSYTDGDFLGIAWKYDCIHSNQIDWYEAQLKSLAERNNGVAPKSLAFFHIPLIEFREAWYEYMDNGYQDSQDIKHFYGKTGETGAIVYSSEYNNGFFDKVLELGSTQGIFCGHDHVNNFSLEYKGVRLTYGYSIDYLAYSNIKSFGSQRGCTMIDVHTDGSFDCRGENYYQDKYQPINDKEEVELEADYNGEKLVSQTHPAQ